MSQETILVIDDSRLVRKMYQHRLVSEAFHVLSADTGEAGFEKLQQQQVDLVLLDLGLPGLGGLEVLAMMKADPSLRSIPVIIFSAKEQESEVQKALELGAQGFIAKATTPVEQVVEKIRGALDATPKQEARHYRVGLDPISLDAHDLAVALGLEMLACNECNSGLIIELTPDAVKKLRSGDRLDARILCPECDRG